MPHLGDWMQAVSYHHLDVYKRQGHYEIGVALPQVKRPLLGDRVV